MDDREKKMSDLGSRKCVPCSKGAKPLNDAQINEYLAIIKEWELIEGKRIQKKKRFKDFVQLMQYVNQMAKLAESEGHHPDFSASYNKLTITLWTHAAGGLTENDFILAAKLNQLS